MTQTKTMTENIAWVHVGGQASFVSKIWYKTLIQKNMLRIYMKNHGFPLVFKVFQVPGRSPEGLMPIIRVAGGRGEALR